MPWKECHVVDERLRFICPLLDGEKSAALCSEFGICRKTSWQDLRPIQRPRSLGASGDDHEHVV